MEERKNKSDPTHGYQNQSFEEEFSERFFPKREEAANNAVDTDTPDTDTPASQSEKEPSPPEAVMRGWEFIKKPEHANAVMAFFTILIFLATSAYAVIATLQWCAMRDANSFLSKQLEGTTGATLKIDRSFNLDSIRNGTNLMFNARNNGQATARDVHGVFSITIQQISDNNVTRNLGVWTFTMPEIAANQVSETAIFKLDISIEEMRQIFGTQSAIKIEGPFSYYNGFSTYTQTMCYLLVWADYRTKSGNIVGNSGGYMPRCDEFPARLQTLLIEKAKQAAEP